MKQYLNILFLVISFVVSFLFFFFTSATVVIPGTSAQFLATSLFPGVLESVPAYPLDAVVYHGFMTLLPSTWIMVGVRFLMALTGACIVILILRSLQLMILLAVCDSVENSPQELQQARLDRQVVKRIVTCVFTPLVMVAFPLWVLATRPVGGQLTVLVVMIFFWISLFLRQQYATALERGEQLPSSMNVSIAGAFFCFAVLLMLSPMLLVILILPLVLSGRVFTLIHFENRMTHLFWAMGGLLVGALVAMFFFAKAWVPLYCPTTEASWGLLWLSYFQDAFNALPMVIQSFNQMAAWVFYLLQVVLFLGTFPKAFYKAFTPIFGQICILVTWGFVFVGWPSSFWEAMIEPSPIATFGMIVLLLNTSLLVSSWMRNWLDVHVHEKFQKKCQFMVLLAGGSALVLTGGMVYCYGADAACLRANEALHSAWSSKDFELSDRVQTWLNPSADCYELIVHRTARGLPLTPITMPTRHLDKIVLQGKPWAVASEEDVLLKELATIGDAPLTQYLEHSQWSSDIFIGNPYHLQSAALVKRVEHLRETNFAQTILGKRMILDLYRRAAVQLANVAVGLPPKEALQALRLATHYDVENKGVALSLAALQDEGMLITPEEKNRAITIYNEFPHLKKPSREERSAFEHRYGAVRTPAFTTARRLTHIASGAMQSQCLDNLRAIYQKTPHVLSLNERLYILLQMDQKEAFEVLKLRDIASLDGEAEEYFLREVELFLLLHIHQPLAWELYQLYHHRLSKAFSKSALLQASPVVKLYGENVSLGASVFNKLSEEIISFYSRDHIFAYAYYYVDFLINNGELEKATDFLSSFDVRESLKASPLLGEMLSKRLVDAWLEKEPSQACQLLSAWLFSEPNQPLLWTCYLSYLHDYGQPEDLQKAFRTCLSYHPLHVTATHYFAEWCQQQYGETVAQRYRESILKAQQTDARMAPHAHR